MTTQGGYQARWPPRIDDIRGYAPHPAFRALWPYYDAIEDVASSPLSIVCIGDSITEGFYATTLAGRWIERLASRLGNAISGAAAPVYYPAHTTQTGYTWPWTLAGGTNNTTYGLGRRAYNLPAAATMSISFTGTSFTIFWTRQVSGGTFSYAVDGGAATNVDTSGAEASGRTTTVTGLSNTAHTVAIARISGTSVIEGLIGYSGTAGIRIYDGGHSGYTSADFVDGSNPRWIDAIATIQPALVIVGLGVNDTQTVSAATYKANIETLIANIRAQTTTDPAIALLAMYQHGAAGGFPFDDWSDYVTALDDLASANDSGEIMVIDLTGPFGGYSGVTTALGGLHPDRVHPTNAGHSLIADTILEALAPGAWEVPKPAATAFYRGTKVTHTVDQALTNGSYVTLNFDTNTFDPIYAHSTSSANLTGTVAKAAASTTLTGTGTAFTSELRVGQVISVPGTAAEKRVVVSIASATSLTVNSAFANSASGQTVARVNSAIVALTAGFYRATAYAATTASPGAGAYIALLVNGAAVALGPVPNDSVGGAGVVTAEFQLAQWDYIETAIRVGAVSKNAVAAGYSPFLSLAFLGTA